MQERRLSEPPISSSAAEHAAGRSVIFQTLDRTAAFPYSRSEYFRRYAWLIVTIYNLGPVKIGDHSVISQDAYLCAGTHDYTLPTLPLLRTPITIGHGVWIAAGAFIGPGVSIGDNSVIGARSVVMKDIPADVIAAGNPCRVIKPREMKA
jgi:acetyltransferase-like isoleucine patch superfamily enzyme